MQKSRRLRTAGYFDCSVPFGLALSTMSGRYCANSLSVAFDGEAEMAREFLHLGAAENSLELIFGDRKIGAGPEPGFDLGVEPALLQRGDETVEIAVLRLGQHRMDGSGQRRRFATVPRAPLSAPPRSRPSNKPMVASSTRLNAPA